MVYYIKMIKNYSISDTDTDTDNAHNIFRPDLMGPKGKAVRRILESVAVEYSSSSRNMLPWWQTFHL